MSDFPNPTVTTDLNSPDTQLQPAEAKNSSKGLLTTNGTASTINEPSQEPTATGNISSRWSYYEPLWDRLGNWGLNLIGGALPLIVSLLLRYFFMKDIWGGIVESSELLFLGIMSCVTSGIDINEIPNEKKGRALRYLVSLQFFTVMFLALTTAIHMAIQLDVILGDVEGTSRLVFGFSVAIVLFGIVVSTLIEILIGRIESRQMHGYNNNQ